MAAACFVPAAGGFFVTELFAYIDCQSRSLGTAGYQVLADPQSSVGLTISGLLVVFVAFIGYRILLGDIPDIRKAVLWLVRIGVVLTLAQSWPAVRVLIYDTATRGPIQLADEITRPTSFDRSGTLLERVQILSDSLDATNLRLFPPTSGSAPSVRETVVLSPNATAPAAATPSTQQANGNLLALRLPVAKLIFQVSTLGTLAAARAAVGLLIAIAPLFAAFLLFDTTRGLFAGWLRALLGAALTVMCTTVLAGLEVTVLTPLIDALQNGPNDSPINEAPDILLATLVFAVVIGAGIWAATRIAAGFRFPVSIAPGMISQPWINEGGGALGRPMHLGPIADVPAKRRPRALSVADAIATSDRREAAAATSLATGQIGRAELRQSSAVAAPLGHTHRRTRTRVSASAGRRDTKS